MWLICSSALFVELKLIIFTCGFVLGTLLPFSEYPRRSVNCQTVSYSLPKGLYSSKYSYKQHMKAM